MVFLSHLRGFTGSWREHVKLVQHLEEVIHLFYMPEVHQVLVPMLLDFLLHGNKHAQEAACSCLAKILQYQHHSPSRTELLQAVKKELYQSSKWAMRKTHLYFCKYVVQVMPLAFFREHFLKEYLEASRDKVSNVRREFATALLVIKPYFERDIDLAFELMELLTELSHDTDQDVVEAAEHTDYALLQRRKQKKMTEEDDLLQVNFQARLAQREK